MKHKVHTEIHLCRWIDEAIRWHRKEYDGYTALIQVDFLDDENSVIEIDEFVCSVFLVISYIAYFPLKRKYRVSQSDNLDELWDEIEIVIGLLDSV